jgi:hypothetical protein
MSFIFGRFTQKVGLLNLSFGWLIRNNQVFALLVGPIQAKLGFGFHYSMSFGCLNQCSRYSNRTLKSKKNRVQIPEYDFYNIGVKLK